MPRENSAILPERAFDNDGDFAACRYEAALGVGVYQEVR
jgi:hypothetical protein